MSVSRMPGWWWGAVNAGGAMMPPPLASPTPGNTGGSPALLLPLPPHLQPQAKNAPNSSAEKCRVQNDFPLVSTISYSSSSPSPCVEGAEVSDWGDDGRVGGRGGLGTHPALAERHVPPALAHGAEAAAAGTAQVPHGILHHHLGARGHQGGRWASPAGARGGQCRVNAGPRQCWEASGGLWQPVLAPGVLATSGGAYLAAGPGVLCGEVDDLVVLRPDHRLLHQTVLGRVVRPAGPPHMPEGRATPSTRPPFPPAS